MQRLTAATAALILATLASSASAVQDLPGYDLYRGAGAPSSFYAEGFAGYPGSYGAGMNVAGYGYAGNGYSGMGGPFCCGYRVMQGPCNPWANYTGHNPCGPCQRHFGHHHAGHRQSGHCGGAGCGVDSGYVNAGFSGRVSEPAVGGAAIEPAPVNPPVQPIAPGTATPPAAANGT